MPKGLLYMPATNHATFAKRKLKCMRSPSIFFLRALVQGLMDRYGLSYAWLSGRGSRTSFD
jgi:hypothetical protein